MIRKSYVCAALALVAALPVVTRAQSIEERLKQIESKVATLEQENAQLRQKLGEKPKPAASSAAAAVSAMGKEAKLAIGGFVQVQSEFGDSPDSRFPAADRVFIRRARFGLKGSFAENLDVVLQSDWAGNALSASSGFRAQLTDAYVVWNKYSEALVTVGQFKVPYGYEQLLADTKTYTIERTLVNDQLSLPRQQGVMISGTTLEKRLGYAAAFVNGNGNNTTINDNDQFTSIGRVYGTVFQDKDVKLTVGLNAFTGRDTGSFTGRRTGTAADAQLVFGRAELDAEILRTRYDRDVGADTKAEGWYVTGGYFFLPNKLQGVLRYESYDPNTSVRGDDTQITTAGLNYLIKGDDLKLQFSYLLGDAPGADSDQGRFITRLVVVF